MAIYIAQKTVTVVTSGTAVQLDSALKKPSVLITADPTNTGTVFVGDSSVSASSRLGQPLAANENFVLEPPAQFGTDEVINLSKIYVDSTASGDSVHVTWYERE